MEWEYGVAGVAKWVRKSLTPDAPMLNWKIFRFYLVDLFITPVSTLELGYGAGTDPRLPSQSEMKSGLILLQISGFIFVMLHFICQLE